METSLFEIELNDGRIFRIFCANGTQKKKFFWSLHKNEPIVKSWKTLSNGIHTFKQWEEISRTL